MKIIISCSPKPRGRFVSIKQIRYWRIWGLIKHCRTKTSIRGLHNNRILNHSLMMHKGDSTLNSAQQLKWLHTTASVTEKYKTYICKRACNIISTVLSFSARCVILSAAFPEVAHFDGWSLRGTVVQWGQGISKGEKAVVLCLRVPLTKHFLTPMFHTSLHLIIPWDTVLPKPLHFSCLDKC